MANKRSIAITDIPNDVVEAILLRVPVESLFRFKSVNKFFSTLIQNPTFIYKQLHHRRQHGNSGVDHILILTWERARPLLELGQVNNIFFLESPEHELVDWSNVANESSPSLLRDRYVKFAGHCNGLICISSSGNPMGFALWNPALRQYKILPQSRFNNSPSWFAKTYIGFGHELKSRDYKIVRLSFYNNHFDNSVVDSVEAEVYSLRTNSWRPVVHTPSLLDFRPDHLANSQSTHLGGFCYWFGRGTTNSNDRRILSFDLSSEVFLVPHPPKQLSQPTNNYSSSVNLFSIIRVMLWNESIVFATRTYDITSPTKRVDIWLLDGDVRYRHLDEMAAKKKLDKMFEKKRYTIEVDELFKQSLEVELFWSDEILLDCYDMCSVTRNVTTSEQGSNISFDRNYPLFSDIVGYVKSLVSLI